MESLQSLSFHAVGLPDPVSGLSILHAICIQGDTETAKFFLQLSPNVVDTIIVLGVPVLSSSSSPYKGKKPKDILKLFDTPLHKSIQELLTLHYKGLEKWPLMYVAARHGSIEHINKLISRGCSKPSEDRRVIHLAAEYNSVEVMKELVHLGASLWSKDDRGYSAIHYAAKAGRTETVQYLVDTDMSLRDAVGECFHYTPLHLAAWQGHTETAAVLIACGADVHAGEEEFSYEGIHHYFKRSDDFRDGIRGHNGENTRCEGKVTPILLAARQGHLDTFELLEQEGGQYFHHPVLFLAVKGGSLALLKKLVSRGLDVKNRDDGGRTLLHFVNSEEEAKILLDLGLDAMSTDAYDVTPLHHAAQIGNIKLADVLIEHGADVSAKTSTGWTPLVYAVINKNCSPNMVSYFAQKLRQSGRKKIASDVALHHSRSLDPEIARILIDFGFEVNKRTRQGSTPLHSAVDGEPETVKLLIENGAKIHVVNCLGNTPFHNAARLGKPETLRFLLSKDAKLIEAVGWRKRTALHFACEWGNVDCVQFLLEHGSNLKAVDSKGNNALHRAIRCGQWRSCQRTTEILLKHAADDHADNRDNIINAANKEGWTALHFAAVYGDLSLVEMLLKFGFAIDAINNNGETPLHLATDVSIVKLLVERGADTRIANKEGDTVLHVAAHYSGYSDLIVEFLLDQNFADVHSPNARGKTPLHLTSESLQCEKAEMLLQKGAQVNAMDNEGCTPLHVAVRDSYSPTFWQVLIERGADVNAADKKGNTVLHMAADKPRGQDLLSFLIERGGGHTIRNKKGKTSGDLLKSYNDHRNSRLRRFCRWNFATVLGTWIWSCRRILTLISQVIAHLGFGKTENILTHLLVFRPILPSLSLFFLLPCYFLTNSLLGRTKNCRYCRSLLKL